MLTEIQFKAFAKYVKFPQLMQNTVGSYLALGTLLKLTIASDLDISSLHWGNIHTRVCA